MTCAICIESCAWFSVRSNEKNGVLVCKNEIWTGGGSNCSAGLRYECNLELVDAGLEVYCTSSVPVLVSLIYFGRDDTSFP